MWGVGKVTQETLARLNIHTFGDLSRVPVKILEKKFGKAGLKMHALSLGIDDRDVIPVREAKSVGHEETFLQDVTVLDEAKKELLALSAKLARRMRGQGVVGKTITLKVKYSDFVQITRSTTLAEATDDGSLIYSTVCRLLGKTEVGKRPARLLGVSLSQLGPNDAAGQLSLFLEKEGTLKRKRLNTALDSLHAKHGNGSVRPGSLIDNL
jgi:DNA polymerase-4